MEVDLATFDPAQPALFYCKREGVIELADAWVLVDDTELPVHQAVLGMHSSVFLHAYMSEREGPTGNRVVTSAGFEGFALRDVALFLRLVYHPTDATPANLARLHTSLPAMARLAHTFVVQPLLAAIEQHLLQLAASSTSGSTSSVAALPEMLGWLDLADELHMDGLLAVEARKAAQRLLEGLPGGTECCPSFNGISAAVQLLSLRPRAGLLVLAALLTSAGLLGNGTVGALANGLPSAETIIGWAGLELDGQGELTWEVPVSDLNSGEAMLTSPQFTAGGLVWDVLLYPQGYDEDSTGHLSLFLRLAGTGSRLPSAGVKAGYCVELVNTKASRSAVGVCTDGHVFQNVGYICGWFKFLEASKVQTPGSGFVHDGKLRIKARMVV